MSGELFFRLPWSHIVNGLEKLIGSLPGDDVADLWQRLRLDDDFRARVAKYIVAEDKRPEEVYFEVEVDYSRPREEIYKEILGIGLDVLRLDLVEALHERTEEIPLRVLSSRTGKKRVKLYIVQLYRELDERHARTELKRREYVPAQADEALAFYFQARGRYRVVNYDHDIEGIFALDAMTEWEGELNCLSFGHSISGNLLMSLHSLQKKIYGAYSGYGLLARRDIDE